MFDAPKKDTFKIQIIHILEHAYLCDKQNEIITEEGIVSQKASWRRWIMRWVLRGGDE